MKDDTQYRDIIEKQKVLDAARVTLKNEFAGIDEVIDQAIELLSPWHLFPEIQERPVVINLWGLTGVGKTSLVNRIAQLLDYEGKYFNFDLGDNDTRDWSVKRQLEEISENLNGDPVIIALDEFQHARTINEDGTEIDKRASRIIWQLIDSGKFQISGSTYLVDEIYGLMQRLRYLLRNGVQVAKGLVVSRREYFIEHMDHEDDSIVNIRPDKSVEDAIIPFIPKKFHEDIFNLDKERFNSTPEVQEVLRGLGGYESVRFLEEIIYRATGPKTVDCTNSLVFVLGNLDEAYKTCNNYNPDIDADEYYRESKTITVPHIKNALKRRFRNEQISRLGNNHIIYPSLNRKSFERIIEAELCKTSTKVFDLQHIHMDFDKSINELIYKEGVYPTQGVRPALTTIHQVIHSKLGKILAQIYLRDLSADQIKLSYRNKEIIAVYRRNKQALHEIQIDQELSLERMRRNRKDDLQAITAVHEAGHAIISSILLHTIPEVIYSTTADRNNSGFTYTRFTRKYASRNEMTNRIAMHLAGFAAEELVFGPENVTTGAEEDIETATKIAAEMIKISGMGTIPAAYHIESMTTRSFLYDPDNQVNSEVEKNIKLAMELARKTLKEQEVLLLRMGDYLSDNRMMQKPVIKEYLEEFRANVEMTSILDAKSKEQYRDRLKTRVALLEFSQDDKAGREFNNISLNKTN